MGRNRKGKRNTWQSAEMNNLQYRMYYEMLEQMACAICRWEGLPTEIDQRFLELTLFNRGMSVFFWDDEYDAYFSTMGAPSGQINMYQNPLAYIAYGAVYKRQTAETFIKDMDKRGADADEYRSSAEARRSEYASNEEAMKADSQGLKARNYDLLMQIPADNSGDGVVVEDVDDDGTVYHIDNLFTDDKEDSNNGN